MFGTVKYHWNSSYNCYFNHISALYANCIIEKTVWMPVPAGLGRFWGGRLCGQSQGQQLERPPACRLVTAGDTHVGFLPKALGRVVRLVAPVC